MEKKEYTVLIVDDSYEARVLIKKILGRCPGLSIVSDCSNIDEAESCIRSSSIDLAIVDIFFREGIRKSGIELLRIAKKENWNTLFIMCTNHPIVEIQTECLREGAKGYLLKDRIALELVNCIHAILQGNDYYPITPDKIKSPSLACDNIFKQEGSLWHLRFKGKLYKDKEYFCIIDMKGLHYIHYLLTERDNDIDSEFLSFYFQQESRPDVLPAFAAEDNLTITRTINDNTEAITLDELKRIEKDLKKIDDDLEEARLNYDQDRIETLAETRQSLLDHISDLTYRGRIKRIPGTEERARKAISKCIDKSLMEIKNIDADMYDHFLYNIKKGVYFRYCLTQDQIDWDTGA